MDLKSLEIISELFVSRRGNYPKNSRTEEISLLIRRVTKGGGTNPPSYGKFLQFVSILPPPFENFWLRRSYLSLLHWTHTIRNKFGFVSYHAWIFG